jgi:hypothetical protein
MLLRPGGYFASADPESLKMHTTGFWQQLICDHSVFETAQRPIAKGLRCLKKFVDPCEKTAANGYAVRVRLIDLFARMKDRL